MLSIFFSAKFLTHRQASSWSNPVQICQPFFNFSSYGNAKLFSRRRCSFQRNIMWEKETEKREVKKEKDNKSKEAREEEENKVNMLKK